MTARQEIMLLNIGFCALCYSVSGSGSAEQTVSLSLIKSLCFTISTPIREINFKLSFRARQAGDQTTSPQLPLSKSHIWDEIQSEYSNITQTVFSEHLAVVTELLCASTFCFKCVHNVNYINWIKLEIGSEFANLD